MCTFYPFSLMVTSWETIKQYHYQDIGIDPVSGTVEEFQNKDPSWYPVIATFPAALTSDYH